MTEQVALPTRVEGERLISLLARACGIPEVVEGRKIYHLTLNFPEPNGGLEMAGTVKVYRYAGVNQDGSPIAHRLLSGGVFSPYESHTLAPWPGRRVADLCRSIFGQQKQLFASLEIDVSYSGLSGVRIQKYLEHGEANALAWELTKIVN